MRPSLAVCTFTSVAALLMLTLLGGGPVRGFGTRAASPQASPALASCFLLGVNYPYDHYGSDFGANAWGDQGVHTSETYTQVDTDFANLAAIGVRTVRWFVFADARAGLRFDATGLPAGIDASVFPDLDAAISIAEQHGIRLDLVLLDFTFMREPAVHRGVQLGGHAAVIDSPDGQDALVSRVFAPVFERYRGRSGVLSWEVMNEPELAVSGPGKLDSQVRHPASFDHFREFVARVVQSAHSLSSAPVTLGAASARSVGAWVGLGLDYYQVHYYDWMVRSPDTNLYPMPSTQLGLDRPVVVGEFPAADSIVSNLEGYLDTWYANGYAGAWPWSFRGGDASGTPDTGVLGAWAAAHAESRPLAESPDCTPWI